MRRWLISLFCALVPASAAFADDAGPQRAMTGTESAAYDSVRTAVMSALPKPPQGYSFLFTSITGLDEGMVPQPLQPDEMFRMGYRAAYKFNTGAVVDRQMAEILARMKGTPAQKQRTIELNTKEAELRKARDQAHGYTEKERIRAELKTVREEQKNLSDAIAAGNAEWARSAAAPAPAQIAGEPSPPKEFTIAIWINADANLSDKSAPCSIANAPVALEMKEGCDGDDSYCVTVLLGAFDKVQKVSGYTLYVPRDVKLAVPTRPRAMAITVSGPRDRAADVREFAGKIDLGRLRAMLP